MRTVVTPAQAQGSSGANRIMPAPARTDLRRLRLDALKEKYRRDFDAFAREQLLVRGREPGQILPLNFYGGQRIFHELVEKQRKEEGWIRAIAIKARQIGLSTYGEARMAHGAMLNRNFNTLLIACDPEVTQRIFEIARFFYDNLSGDIRPIERYNSKTELTFDNPDPKTRNRFPGLNSRMTFQNAKNILAGTAATIHGLHISEGSKYDSRTTAMLENTLMPAIHLVPGTIVINEATAFMGGEWFKHKCDAARAGKSEYVFFFMPWWFEPSYRLPLKDGEKLIPTLEEERLIKLAARGQPNDGVPPFTLTPEQLKWRRVIIAQREDGETLFPQEYPATYESAWITMDRNVFDHSILREMQSTLCDPLMIAEMPVSTATNVATPIPLIGGQRMIIDADKDYLAIWKMPERGCVYDIGVDVAAGIQGQDWSVAEVIDRKTHEQVAEYHIHCDPAEFGERLYGLGIWYNEAQIAVERNGPGYGTIGILSKMGYPNQWLWRTRDRLAPKITPAVGWSMTAESKRYAINVTRTEFRKRAATIHSRVLWNELFHFMSIPGFVQERFEAGQGHDDAATAYMICNVLGDDERDGDNIPAIITDPRLLSREERHKQLQHAMGKGSPAYVDNFDTATAASAHNERRYVDQLKGWE